MIVANINDYLFPWQIIPIVLFMLCWVVLGGWLLKWTLKKYAQLRTITIGQCALKMLIMGSGVLLVGGLTYLAIDKLGQINEQDWKIGGLIAGAIIGFAFAFLILYAMLDLTFTRAMKLSLPTMAALLVSGVIVFGTCVPIAISQRNLNKGLADCASKMIFVAKLFSIHSRASDLPANIDEINSKLKNSNILGCPGDPNKKVGYFYLKPQKSIVPSGTLIFCDLGENHGGKGRNAIVLENNRYKVSWYSHNEFQSLLDMPANAEFAKALKAAEGQ